MRVEQFWCVGLPAMLGACVAGSEGPTYLGDPADPEPSLRADLFAGPIAVPDQIRIDSLLEMMIGVRNGGTGQAEPGWVVRVVLSRDQVIDSADIEIDHFPAPRVLPAGARDEYLRHKKLRASTPLGLYYIASILDVTSTVAEVSEANNTLQSPAAIELTGRAPRPSSDE